MVQLIYIAAGTSLRQHATTSAAGRRRFARLWRLKGEQLDRQALTHPVEQHLFEDKASGWATYSTTLQVDVSWFR